MGTSYSDFLSKFSAADPILNPEAFDTSSMPQTKQANVERAAAQKKTAMAGPDGYRLANMRATGSGVASASPMDRDYANLTINQFRQKYGNDIGMRYDAATASGSSAYRSDTQGQRTGGEMASDATKTIVGAPLNLIGSIGALIAGGADAVGLAPEGTGVLASEKLGKFNEFMQGMQSEQLNNARRAYNSETSLQAADTTQQSKIDERAYGSTAAGAIRIASDIKDGLKTAFNDPAIAADTVANAGGSLIGGGLVAGGLKKIGAAILKTGTKVGAVEAGGAVATRIAEVGSRAAMPASIIGMESGAAYQQTAEQAYRQLAGRTDLTESQKLDLANKAALEAAAVQGGVTAAIMPFTGGAKFESAPFNVPNVGTAIKRAIGETVEEGIQEGSTSASQNLGIRSYVDQTQDLTTGIGQAAALGAIGGIGSSVATQAPGVALRGAIKTAKLPFKALSKSLTYVGDRVDARNQKIQDDLLNGIYEQAEAAIPDAEAELEGQPEDIRAKAQATIQKLANHPRMQEAANIVRSTTGNLRDRMMALASLTDMVGQSQEEQETPTPAGMAKTAFQSIKDTVANASQSDSVQKALATGKKLYDDYGPALNVAMQNAMGRAVQSVQNVTDPDARKQQFAEVQENLPVIASMAETAPQEVDAKTVNDILMHDEQGDIILTPKQRSVFRSAKAVSDATQAGSDLASTYGMMNADAVSRQVLTDAPKDGTKLSLNGHLEGVRSAFNAGDTETATGRLNELRHFAQHLSNKVTSFNDALAGGNSNDKNPLKGVSIHLGNGRFREVGETYIQPRSAKSVRLAQQVAVQAQVVAAAVNNLSTALDLPIEPVTPAVLDASLNGDAKEVAKAYATPVVAPVEEATLPEGQSDTPSPEIQDQNTTPEPQSNQDETQDPVQSEEPSQEDNQVEPEASVDAEESVEDAPIEEALPEPEPVAEEAPPTELMEEEKSDPVASDVTPSPLDQNLQEAQPNLKDKDLPSRNNADPVDPDLIREEVSQDQVSYSTPVGGESNRLVRAFKAPKTAKTRVADSVSPIQSVKDTLTSEATMKAALGENLNRRFTKEVANAYAVFIGFADGLVQSLDKRLQAYLKDRLKRGLDLSKALDFLEAGALNLAVQNPDGSYSYDPNRIETATLAALQWYLKMNNHGAPLTDQDVRDLFQLDADTAIPDGLAASLSSGLSPVEVSRSLAQEIGRFWGMDVAADAPENYAQSVLEGVAKELLEVMVSEGLIDAVQVDISDISTRENVKFVNRYRPAVIQGTDQKVLAADNPVRQFPTAIEKAVLNDSEELTYIGEAPKTIAATQLRSNTPTTDEQKEVIAKEQATEHRLNMPYVNMLTGMGEDLVLRLFGGGDTSKPLNENHKRSLEGQNLTVQSAYRSLLNTLTEVSNKASMDGSDVSDMPIHYGYAYTVVNRLQMLGKDNPQSNKLMREAILPTWDTIDLTNPDNRMKFSLGLAQALGVKVHTLGSKEMLASLRKKLDGFGKTLEILSEPNPKITAADIDTMKAEGIDSPVSLHALMEYVRLQNTDEAGRKTFRTAVYFEADGVTNGVINAMSLFTSGKFTPEWISNIERGGLWIGEQVMNLANLRGRDSESGKDLYKVSADKTSFNVNKLLGDYNGGEVHPQITAVLDLLNTFLSGVDYDTENGGLVIDRGATKNPLTITIYGSGPRGIAGNILDDVLAELYSRMSTAAQAMEADPKITQAQAFFGGDKDTAGQKFARLQTTMALLTNNRLVSEKNSKVSTLAVSDGVSGSALRGKSFLDFTVNPKAREVMQENILHAFVEPMVQGITDTVGSDLIRTMTLIKTQTQTWSLVGQFMHQNAYEAALTAKRKANPDMNSYELLTRAENDQIMKQVQMYLPAFSTGTQNFAFGGQQRLNLPFMTSKNGKPLNLEFSRSLTDGFSTPAYGYMPGDAGVSGQPNMTIGSGDGQAVQNIIQNPKTPTKRLQIYDGIHSTVGELDQMSLAANEGVFQSWQNNPLAALSNAFDGFVNQADLNSLSDEQRKVLAKSLLNDWEGVATIDDIMNGLRLLSKMGKDMADGVAQRQAVLKRVQLSVDQMAGAGKPFTQEGLVLSGSPKEVAYQLNRLMVEPVEAMAPEPVPVEALVAPKVVAAPVAFFTKAMERAITKLTSDKLTRALLRDVLRSGAIAEYDIHTGSREELLERAADMGISISPSRQGTFMGFMDPSSKQIFAVDGNPETILHEMIHAATYEAVQAHYDGNSTPETAAAIGRIELLMAEFKSADLGGAAYQNALDEMERQAAAGNQAAELNEFMAWALSNPDIAGQLQNTKVADKLARIARSVIRELKALLFGGKRSAAVKDDVFSNLRFNTSIIMRSQPGSQSMMKEGLLFHDPNFGSNERVGSILQQIKAKVADFVDTDTINRAVNNASLRRSVIRGATVKNAFANAGFDMTMQEQMAFLHMVGIMGTTAQLDANATSRMQDIYSHVIKQLSVDDFLKNPNENDPADNEQANKKFNLIAGKFASRTDGMDRSLVLPAFVALAMTNEEFRQMLSKMKMPKGNFSEWNSVDNILDNIGEMGMNTMSRAVSGESVLSKDAQSALDNLVAQMLETNADAQLFIEKFTSPIGNGIDRLNNWTIQMFDRLGQAAQRNVVRTRAKNPKSNLKTGLAETLQTLAGLLHEPTGHEAAIRMMSAANRTDKIPRFLYDLLNDLTGRTTDTAPVYDLIKIARQFVSGNRQQYVEELPKIINGKFTRELSEGEQTAMHKGLAQTDMASLLTSNSIQDILGLVQSASKRDVRIKSLKDKIRNMSPDNADLIISKADQLADFMVNKKTGSNLLRNAGAIANLLGEGKKDVVATPDMVEAIDHLVSLTALSRQGASVLDPLFSLVHSEAAGLDFVLNLLRGQREIDAEKATGNGKFNHYKGYAAANTADGVSLVVSYDGAAQGSLDAKTLLGMGYVRLGALRGSERDPTAKNRSYWYAPVSGKAGFSQGIAQNIQQTVSGVDLQTGLTNALTGGAINDAKLVQRIARTNKPESYGAALLPVYNEGGALIAYERQVDPRMIEKLKPDTNLAAMIGVRSGRQAEEAASGALNRVLVDRLRDIWDRDRKARSGEFVDLFASKDPIHMDAVKIMSREMKAYIEARFPEGFMVRKDMINDAVGYRAASIGDAWTGTSRWSPEMQNHVRQMLKGMFGNKAYIYAVKAERFLQNSIVQDLRTMIVIRSVIVPAANAASNVYQLIGRGVPMVNVFRSIPKKTAEIEAWHKTRLRQMEAEAELLAATDPLAIRRLEAEIQTIKDSHKRLTIWPLLEAGEFSSISDAGSREDVMLTEGRLSDYVEAMVDKLPAGLKTAGKYAIISKDTALFRALQKTVDYGDFVAKAILFDDLTKRQGKSKADALAQITEEFVNYDKLPGRDRQYLESIGLLWFWNFKVRSAKVAMSMVRNNPVHALISAQLPVPLSGIGLPIEDNLWMSIFDGRAANSVGLHMMFRGPGMLPIGNLF